MYNSKQHKLSQSHHQHVIPQKYSLNIGSTQKFTQKVFTPQYTGSPTHFEKMEKMKERNLKQRQFDEQTILCRPRKYTNDSLDQDEIFHESWRQFEIKKIKEAQEVPKNSDGAKTHRRKKIFNKERQTISRGQPHHKTEFDARNMDITETRKYREKQFSKLPKKTHFDQNPPSPIKNMESVKVKSPLPSRTTPNSLTYLENTFVHQQQYIPSCSKVDNGSGSQAKISFTYENSPKTEIPLKTPQQPKIMNANIKNNKQTQEQRDASKKCTIVGSIALTSQTLGRSSELKRPDDSRVKHNRGILQHQNYEIRSGSQGRSWGNKIRTEIMASQKNKLQRKLTNDIASRVSLNCRESLVVNGQTIDIHKLQIGDYSENISEEDKNSERYHDEDFDLLPQMRRISYNNIDVQRQQSYAEQTEVIKPSDIFVEFQAHSPYEQNPLVIKKVQSKKKMDFQESQPILKELSQFIEDKQLKEQPKPQRKSGLVFPVALVALAIMLLLVQISI